MHTKWVFKRRQTERNILILILRGDKGRPTTAGGRHPKSNNESRGGRGRRDPKPNNNNNNNKPQTNIQALVT